MAVYALLEASASACLVLPTPEWDAMIPPCLIRGHLFYASDLYDGTNKKEIF